MMLNYFSVCKSWGVLLVILLLASACGKTDENSYQPVLEQKNLKGLQAVIEYQIAMVPEGSQKRVAEAYGPLVDYLNARLEGAKLVLIGPKNHEVLEGSLASGIYDLALTSPLQTVRSTEHGYRVISKKADDSKFYGIWMVRRDSGIKTVGDLKGKKVCYPSRTGVAATILPKHFLKSHGLDVVRDVESFYTNSQEATILQVHAGKVSAGTVREFFWQDFQQKHPNEAADLEVKWKTQPLIDQAVIVRNNLPQAVTDRIAALLNGLHETDEGRAILSQVNASKFEPANNATYDIARKFFAENADLLTYASPTTESPQKEKAP
jgi:phosphonate transport system substrate-binding protein